jgi:hypothetical protein
VSRWWPERLVIGLAPDRVDLLHLCRWPGRSVVDEASLTCTPAAGEAPWAAALRTLESALQSTSQPGPSANDVVLPAAMSAGASVTVVLSNHFMRYLVLPWQPALTRSNELATLARLRFEQIHGAPVADWTVQLADAGYGAPLMACAVDTGLVAGMNSLMKQHGLRLTSMQGLLMAAYNQRRQVLAQAAAAASAEQPAALALIEPGRLCLALLAGGQWLSVTTRRVGADAGPVIEQELAALQVDPACLDVLLVAGASRPQLDSDRPVRLLAGPGEMQALGDAASGAPSSTASLAVWGTA